MGKVAFIFPGQASQYSGMGKELADKFSGARAVFDEADKTLGFAVSKLCFEGTEDDLKLTANTQPAILAVSVAALRVLAEKGMTPDYVAGHSLGEYSALVAAGSLSFADAVKLVRKRGTYMQEAVPAGQGSMAAIMGLAPTVVLDVCKHAAQGEVCSPANLNSPEQTVISGHAGAVKRAVEIASQSGAKRAVVLAVSAPFHCALMMPAQQRLEKDLASTKFAESANAPRDQRRCGYDHRRRGSQQRAGAASDHAGALGRVDAVAAGRRREHLCRSWPRQSAYRIDTPDRAVGDDAERRR